MRIRMNVLVAALVVGPLLAAGPAFAQKAKNPAPKLFGAHGKIGNLTETAGACPGFTCDASGAECFCYQAFGQLNVKPFGLSDINLKLNLNKAPDVSTGVGGNVYSGEGLATIIPHGQTQNLINLVFGGFNLCETQQGILLGKLGAALAGGAGKNETIEGIGDLALLISTIEDHIDMELDGNYFPSGFVPPAIQHK